MKKSSTSSSSAFIVVTSSVTTMLILVLLNITAIIIATLVIGFGPGAEAFVISTTTNRIGTTAKSTTTRHTSMHQRQLQQQRHLLLTLPTSSLSKQSSSSSSFTAPSSSINSNSKLYLVGDAQGDYYGESSGSFMVREFSKIEELEEIVQLASQSLPERPDGIVTVVKYTSASEPECRATEAEYERMARQNPATIFLRCFAEYENTNMLFGTADVTVFPTFDVFYGGNRVARVVGGPDHVEVEELLQRYQMQNSKLDLFSEEGAGVQKWHDGRIKDAANTPRTTSRFVPGYDWDKSKGFFDDVADKAKDDFESQYGNWLPNTDDE